MKCKIIRDKEREAFPRMPAEIKKKIELEVVHVLFLDIVGYSKRLTNEQQTLIDQLNQVVRRSEEFQNAEAAGRLIKIPTGDGMALVFYKSPAQPVECALEISHALKTYRTLDVERFLLLSDVTIVTFFTNHVLRFVACLPKLKRSRVGTGSFSLHRSAAQ